MALVTGGSRGIGRGIALEFAREGADVAVNYRRDEAAARATVAEIERLGRRRSRCRPTSPTGPQVERMVARALAAFGRLDIVVANSGVASRTQTRVGHGRRALAQSDRRRSARRLLHLQGDGEASGRPTPRRIILVSSIGADVCGPLGAPYYVAKAGVNALTKSLAKECAPAGVRVNCIAPGLIETDMGTRMMKHYGDAILSGIPLGRPGQPEDIGRAAVFLASDDGGFITGKILRIDGGAWM